MLGDQAEDPGSWPLGLVAVLGPEPPHPAVSPNSNRPAGSQGRAGFRSGLLDPLVTYQNTQGRGPRHFTNWGVISAFSV